MRGFNEALDDPKYYVEKTWELSSQLEEEEGGKKSQSLMFLSPLQTPQRELQFCKQALDSYEAFHVASHQYESSTPRAKVVAIRRGI